MGSSASAEQSPRVVANVIIGSRFEPFFASCLASVAKAIDHLVLNDNSGDPNNENLKAFYASELFRANRTSLIQTRLADLSGFDEARNLCLRETEKLFPPGNVWILDLDSDEVHTPELAVLTRNYLPKLSSSVSSVDGYFYQFFQSFDYYLSIDRRHNLLVRYHPEIHWEGPIHEKLRGISGKRIPTDYLFYHYGYVYPPEVVLDRWKLYKRYDPLSMAADLEKLDPKTMFNRYEKLVVRFRGVHPEALSLYFGQQRHDEHIAQFTEIANSFFSRHAGHRLKAKAREVNWRLRLASRALQAKIEIL